MGKTSRRLSIGLGSMEGKKGNLACMRSMAPTEEAVGFKFD
jgi:hypothetical protein